MKQGQTRAPELTLQFHGFSINKLKNMKTRKWSAHTIIKHFRYFSILSKSKCAKTLCFQPNPNTENAGENNDADDDDDDDVDINADINNSL